MPIDLHFFLKNICNVRQKSHKFIQYKYRQIAVILNK